MKKHRIIAIITALSITVATGIAFAASTKCQIESIKGDTVVMDCGSKAAQFTAGQKVKIKTKSKQAAIEGC